MTKAVFTAMLIMIFCMYLFKLTKVSRIMIGIFFIFNISFLAFSKGITFKLLMRCREKGYNYRNILIIGSREGAKDVIDTIGERKQSGYRIMGCLDIDEMRSAIL